MGKFSILTVLLVMGMFLEISLAVKPDWVSFMKQYKKEYKSAENAAKAMAKFEKTLARVDEHNKKFQNGEVQYTLAINEFADEDPDEFHLTHHGLKPELRLDDSTRSVPHERYVRATPPDSFDWRSSNKVSAVRNQGKCGSCWAFTSLSAVESQVLIAGKSSVLLSEQHLLDCDTVDLGCNGGWPTNTFKWLQNNGGSKADSAYPYTSGCCNTTGKCSGANAPAVQTVTGFERLTMPATDDTLKSFLVTHGPLAIAVSGSEKWDPQYATGYLSRKVNQTMDHAVLLVGYGADSVGKKYWIIKNSWGTGWGDKGFAKILAGQNDNVDCSVTKNLAAYPTIS
ncbi:ervatamin-B [Folsomia candida]|uniref:Cathepsin L n=1 Tax=Folsomia candida TaxID=158441 RepID=A0A226DQK5_FOLCA|nr:ervatamin-B [Folsomia candida]OXA47360.1 Cathepsin L [Folsomia candida]